MVSVNKKIRKFWRKNKMSNILEKVRTGIFTIKIGGDDLKIKPSNDDKLRLMAINKVISEFYNKDSDVDGEKRVDDLNKEKSNIIKEAIKKANPDSGDDQVDNFLLEKQADVEEELGVCFGWYTRKQFEKLKEKQLKNLEGMTDLKI